MTRTDCFLGCKRRYYGRISTNAELRHPKPTPPKAKEATK
jgi:hypothetical protein